MTWLGIMWLCLAIFAIAMFIFTHVWLFFKGLSLYRTVSAIEFPAEGQTTRQTPRLRPPAPTGNPVTLTSARVARQEIKIQRRYNKAKRLQKAEERWAGYGLVELPR